ncbi:MAG: glycosyltransferase, partial [Nitrospinota bacterium]
NSVLKNIRLYSEMHRFIPAMTSVAGTRYTEIVVSHHARQFGESKYGISRVWRVILDLLMVKMIVGFTSRPITWFGLLSLPFLVSGILFSIASIFFYIYPPSVDYFPIVIPSVSFLFLFLFFHLFLLGFLAEMIFKTGDFKQKEVIDMLSVKIV